MTINASFGNIKQLLASMEPSGLPKTVLSGDPQMSDAELADTDKLNAGVWSSQVGSWRIDGWSVNEVMVIQSGRALLTEDDGHVTELGPGDAFFAPKGWKGTWETLEPVQKFYVIVY